VWLITEADVAQLSGVPRPGSREWHDLAKIARAVEVARVILGRFVETAGSLAPD
jgi:hypothetical protein